MPSAAKLISRIPEIMAELAEVKDSLDEPIERVAQGARERVPVETGTLRDAIHTEETKDGYGVIAGDTDAFYGHMVEFGTTHSAAHPFLLPAFEAERDSIESAIRDRLGDL